MPDYKQKILDMVAAGKIRLTPDQISYIELQHDDWCAALNVGGKCDCKPDVVIRAED